MTSCCECGAPAPEPLPLTWSTFVDGGRTVLLCDGCTRQHVRAMEARLDKAWW